MRYSLKGTVLFLLLISICSSNGCRTEKLEKYTKDLPFDMTQIVVPKFPSHTENIIDHGAVGDGQTLNTDAFSDAIRACASAGGGRVCIPAGIWLTGPIRLQSNINLYLEKGALIQFSYCFEDYPLIRTSWEGLEQVRCISPIYGAGLENVGITGQGIIDGAGEAWRPVKKFKTTERQWQELLDSGGAVSGDGSVWWPSEQAMNGAEIVRELKNSGASDLQEYAIAREYLRPVMINLNNCKNVLLDGPTFQNSPAWNIHPLMCENMVIRNITVLNPWYSQNGDGLDLESCRNVLVYDCQFDVGDDAICIKSGKNEYGRRRGKPSENIAIADCIVYHGHGGFTVGSEMSGGVRNIDVRRCTFLGTDVGLRFKSTRGRGGVVENIYIRDIYMKDIPTEAIRFNMFYDNKAPIPEVDSEGHIVFSERLEVAVSEETPRFRNIHIKNIYCREANQAVLLLGLPEMAINNVELDSIFISANAGLVCVDADNITLRNLKIVPENGPVLSLLNSRNVLIQDVVLPEDCKPFMVVNGKKSAHIRLKGNIGAIRGELVAVGKEVSSDALISD
ncbi:MAG: glycoside hydrolase family 28 protein [Fidelibacterota bacterium]|nr:MAG: glycoside hydrolase family 28 protein [Candidatus Neomarinimicrobiota bacterium]